MECQSEREANSGLSLLLGRIRSCARCRDLPLGPRPVLRASDSARILVAAQAPGTRVHDSGIPFNDPSGDRLREWMGIDRNIFYDEARINIIPMGFCYPGRDPRGGDLPPRPECAAAWHDELFRILPDHALMLVIGQYAQRYHLTAGPRRPVTEQVRAWREYQPRIFPLPHPSPRNNMWLRRNPWFEAEVVPALRLRVRQVLEA